MLVIRMQRTGRKGHAQFRVVIQDSRRTPTSGKIVAQLGHFNPHSKETVLDKEKAKFYLEHGAQPSPRVARLLKAEGVKLPRWVKIEKSAKRAIKNPEKLRRNRPAEAEKPTPDEPEAAPAEAEEPAPAETEAPAEADTAQTEAEVKPEVPETAEKADKKTAEPAAETAETETKSAKEAEPSEPTEAPDPAEDTPAEEQKS